MKNNCLQDKKNKQNSLSQNLEPPVEDLGPMVGIIAFGGVAEQMNIDDEHMLEHSGDDR